VPAKEVYQVRDGRGRIRTVIGFSHRGVVKIYLSEYPTLPGETIEVKRRGFGPDDWQAFKVS
jgi:hypothetical protein